MALDQKPDGTEPEEPASPTNLNPGVAETLADVLRDLITNLGALRITTEKANTAFIAYMDRIIILAGGTLTLIFTVLGVMSGHLQENHKKVTDVPLVIIACWLLIVVIVAALSYNSVALKLGMHRDHGFVTTIVDAQVKLKLLTTPHVTTVKDIPSFFPQGDAQKGRVKSLERATRIYGVIAQMALLAAFICLALFIQVNVLTMLS